MKSTKKIAILGAGPMGLAVAYQLALDGYRPVIYEADDRIGGMAAAFDFSGTLIERYYHFHCTSDISFFNLISELAIDNHLHWVPVKMGYWYQNKLQPWGDPLALLRFKGLSISAKLRYAAFSFAAIKRNNWKDLDQKDAVRWVRSWVGNEAYNILWKKLFEYKFYHFTTNLSAAWIWSRVRRIGRSRYNIFREKLGYLEGGSETLLQAMRKSIEAHGGKIYLNSPVQEVVIASNQIKGVVLNEELFPFDAVISTIPLPNVSKVFPGLPQKILEQYKAKKNIAVICVVIKLKKPVTNYFWLNTNDEDMEIPGIIEYSNLYPMNESIVYVPFYIPGEHPNYLLDNDYFISRVKLYLKKINPTLTDEDIIDFRASRYRFAQPICEPGYLASLPKIDVLPGLWIADTSYYYPEDRGISESVNLGRKIAKSVAGYL